MAGWLELIGSLLLLVGLFTRPAAFLLAGEMAIAYWMIHAPQSFFPIINRGETAILFCFIFLLFVPPARATWSVDDELLKRRDEREEEADVADQSRSSVTATSSPAAIPARRRTSALIGRM